MSIDIAELGLSVRSDGVVVATDRLDDFERSGRKAESAAKRLQRQTDRTGRAMKSMGRNMTLYVTTPILAAAAASVKLGATFDSTLTQMNTLVGVSRKELIGFRKDILALGPAVGKGPVELADAMFAITSAGQRGALAMDTLTKSAKASAIGLGDTRQVALAATAAVQAYGRANMDSTTALEILIGTIEKGNLSAEELVPVMGRVIGIAAEMGVAFEDLGAFIATFSLLGVKADEAATSLRGVLSAIQAPTPDALQAFEDLETSIDEVRRSIKEKGFIATFQELVRESRRLNVDLVALVPNVRALSGVLGVFGGEGKLAEQNLMGIINAIGTLDERFEAMKELDPSFAFRIMSAEIQVSAIGISQDLMPAVLEIVKEIGNLAKAFSDLSAEQQTSIIRWALMAAALGPVLIVMGSMVRTLSVMIPWFVALHGVIVAKLLPAIRLTMIRLAGLSGSMGLMFGPAGLVAAGVVALGLLAIAMIDTEREATELDKEIDALIESMEKFGKTSFELAVQKLNMAIAENDSLVGRLNDNLQLMMDMQSRPMGAQASDNLAMQMAQLALDIESAKAEGVHLEEQLIRLTKAQTDLNAVIANEELMTRYNATMKEYAENVAWLLEHAPKVEPPYDAKAFAELLDTLDPSIEATKEYHKQWALLQAAFDAGDIPEAELKRLQRLLQTSALANTAFGNSIKKNLPLMAKYAKTMKELEGNFEWLDELEELDLELDGLKMTFDPLVAGLEALDEQRKKVEEGFAKGLIEEDQFDRMITNIDRAKDSLEDMHSVMANMLRDTITALGAVRDLFAEESAEAEALSSIMQILAVIEGVRAVIKQLQGGDVYSAIPRAIGVAALIASMGINTGAAGSANNTRTRQESQGTGSVLGDSEAKSESILNAMEITANATSELVGINRGMLHALTNLQTGLTGAVTQLARGVGGDVAIPKATTPLLIEALTGSGIFNLLGLNFIGDLFGKLLGGKVKILDEGIQIEGGMLTDLLNDVLVRAFVDLDIKKHFLDDYDLKTKFADLDDEVGKQFTLVFQSIFDTVEQAAIAIGIPLDDIQERLESFEVETIKISLQDLTAEEQQAELLAVFSKIFDDLAGHVVPFIDDFQKVGEGLGETLVRVATSIQVMQEAIMALGLSVDDMDPETFAHMSVDLVELTGGVEEFISKFTTFFGKFANEAQQLEFVTSQVERAFADVGLEVPKTADGMWELMQSLDATTEEGREQIAMLLNISATAAEYYDLLEDRTQTLLDQADHLRAFTGDTVFSGLLDLRDNFNAAMKAAKALGASQKEYALIAGAFNRQLRRMAAELTLSVISQVKQLFGDELSESITGGLNEVNEVANSVFEEWMRALEDIYDFTQSILLDEQLTTLTPAEQLVEAQSQFDKLLTDALAGDAEAAAALPNAAKALLEEARFMFASGQQYTDVFNQVMAALNSITMPDIPATIPDAGDPDIIIVGPEQTANDILAEELNRFLMALDLAGTLRDLSQVLNTSVIGLADELGVPLRELVTLMGLELQNISIATAAGLGEIAVLLGADIFELIDALDIGLADLLAELPSGIREDLQPLLEAIRNATTDADVTDGVDNLGAYILGLPADLQLLLAPFLAWFDQPTDSPEVAALIGIEQNTADIVAAIHLLISTMGGEVEPLVVIDPVVIPPVVVPPVIVPPVIIPPIIVPPPVVILPPVIPPMLPPIIFPPIIIRFPEMRAFADGGSVDRTGPAMLHAGEFVVTKNADNMNVTTGDNESSGDLTEVKAILTDILEQNRRYQEKDLELTGDMESSLKTQAEKTRRNSNA